ncbi:MAG: FtsX-like permease family protein, partial [Gemmatimonadetes bacterium]|nr:FtsX-like permease family protein [Gemmatimonadota bacterium]NIR76906.1 FtsX-like permease family protein [Gemmatimonadota bacterium]NIT85427.1 FtsX-like permease family protein [Gemmatimonadota bacterium]NIU29248.1 FtsX-like permease family protein [Gemmatimonadota bacterium]NIU34334.1 FtsX-like permease family protein [Gemmatimonadota bacterium]
LVRTGERRRELAVRAALGAGRTRLVRGLLVEGLVLALAGGALGLLVGLAGIRGLVALQPGEIVPPDGLRLDPSVLAFTAALSLATVLLFALVPALRAGRLEAGETLKEGGRRAGGRFSGGRDGGLLVAGEVALAVLVVGGAALMGRSFLELRDVDPGFRVENRLTATISLPGSSYDSGEEIVGFYDALLDRLEGLPGVRSAAVTRSLPLADTYWTSEFTAESWGAGEYGVDVRHREVGEGYFRTLGVPLLRGRSFTREDRAGSPHVIVVNEALAEHYFPDEDPVGARIAFTREPSERSTWYTVVGVVGNERQSSLRAEAGPEIVAPFRQDWTTTVRVVLHAEDAPAVLVEPLRREVRDLDPDLPVFRVRSLEGLFAESLARERFLLALMGVFAATALLLASLGIYGVTARTTRRRTREIGVRIAVGARGRDVLGMVLARGGVMVGGGLAVGLAGAAVAGRALESLLFGVSPTDPLTLGSVAVVLGCVGLL